MPIAPCSPGEGGARDDHGRTALHWAAASGLCEAMQALTAADEAGRCAVAVGGVCDGGGDAAAAAPVALRDVQARSAATT